MADDHEPVTAEWLRANGWEGENYSFTGPRGVVTFVPPVGDPIQLTFNTRGELREFITQHGGR